MISKITITPKFNTRQIVNEAIDRKWFTFQAQLFSLGHEILGYMQGYINANTKRSGNTGKLANAMTIDVIAGAGKGMVFWGIGKMSELQQSVPYWYVVNYGKMITGQPYIPFHGKTTPGSFGGNRPDSAMSGQGTEHFDNNDGSGFSVSAKTPIRPMNFISASRHQLDVRLRLILASLTGGK